jgi:rhodanese-related sulfurtransferase
MFVFWVGILIVAAALLVYYFFFMPGDPQVILLSAEDARKKLQSGEIRSVVDVRKAESYQAGHYKDAVSFPLKTINPQTINAKITAERIYSPTLIYCNSGRYAKKAAEMIAEEGGVEFIYYVEVPYWELQKED